MFQCPTKYPPNSSFMMQKTAARKTRSQSARVEMVFDKETVLKRLRGLLYQPGSRYPRPQRSAYGQGKIRHYRRWQRSSAGCAGQSVPSRRLPFGILPRSNLDVCPAFPAWKIFLPTLCRPAQRPLLRRAANEQPLCHPAHRPLLPEHGPSTLPSTTSFRTCPIPAGRWRAPWAWPWRPNTTAKTRRCMPLIPFPIRGTRFAFARLAMPVPPKAFSGKPSTLLASCRFL